MEMHLIDVLQYSHSVRELECTHTMMANASVTTQQKGSQRHEETLKRRD